MNIDKLLNNLVSNINAISRQKSLADTCKLATEHIVELFGFDYAVISLFDFKERQIVSREEYSYVAKDKDLGLQDPANWVSMSVYPENNKDILVQVFHQRRIVKTIGRFVFDSDKQSYRTQENQITFNSFNDEIFKKYEHQRLARFYVPIIHREITPTGTQIDFSIGVIEIGIKERYDGQFSIDNETQVIGNFNELLCKMYPDVQSLEDLLQLYTDNFAQSCYRYLIEEEATALRLQITDLKSRHYTESDFSYHDFAREVTKKHSSIVKADWGIISFKTFESNVINYLDGATYFSDETIRKYLNLTILENRESMKENSIVEYVCTQSYEPYYSDDVRKPNEIYLESIDFPRPIISELVVPIFYEDELVGVVDLYSEKPAYFNSLIAQIVKRSMETFASFYMAKKRQHAYNNLIKPTESWKSSKELYHQLIRLLSDFYNTNNISLWERDTSNQKENEFVLDTSGTENKEFVSTMALELGARKKITQVEEWPEVQVHYNFEKSENFLRFCSDNAFKFYISLSIQVNRKYELFVNIFSKLDILKNAVNKEEAKDNYLRKQLEFLRQISTKVSLTLQNLRVIEAMRTMSDPINPDTITSQSLKEVFRKIVKNAQSVTGADFVTLFPFYPEKREIRRSDGISSDDSENPSNERAIFADAIFGSRSNREMQMYIFDSDKECTDLLISFDPTHDPADFQNSYRVKNKISSTCAMRLDSGNEAVGVMFFNYVHPQTLKDNIALIQVIRFFSSFAANLLFLNRELDMIRKRNDDLDEKYMKLDQRYYKMIPLITRNQFYLIVEGVNHIMKNALGGILGNLDDVTKLNTLKGNDRSIFNERKSRVEKSLKLVRSVLSIFKFREGQNKKSYIDIREIIEQTINFFKIQNDDIEYIVSSEEDFPDILFEEAEFAMIIYNLLYNSIAAIELANRKEGRIRLHVAMSKDQQNFVITIEDNGIGIKHEHDENIYQPDFSTIEGGTGLGLYYVSKTLEEYSGAIEHHSVFREYTKFTLTIPLSINYS